MASPPLLLCLVLAITMGLAAAEPSAKKTRKKPETGNQKETKKPKGRDGRNAPLTAAGPIGEELVIQGEKLLDLSGPAGGKGQDYMDVLLGVRDQSGRLNGEEAR